MDQQKFVSKLNSDVTVHNNNFIGIASYNIFVGIYVATIFGSAFFFDLFWPERKESQGVKIAWKICSVFACMLTLACALAYTYIVASQSAYVTGTNAANAQRLLALYGGSPLKYSSNGRAIASVVFLWPGMIFTFVRYVTLPSLQLSLPNIPSTYLLWHSLAHIDAYGPMSKHARTEKTADSASVTGPTDLDNQSLTSTSRAVA